MKTHRRLNGKLFLLLIVATAGVFVGLYFLHNFQVRRTASQLLVMADRAEQANKPELAIGYLERYRVFRKADLVGRSRLGFALAKRAKYYQQKKRAAELLESVGMKDPSKVEELRKAAELYSEIGLHRLAAPHWVTLLALNPKDGLIVGKQALAAVAISDYPEAEKRYQEAIKLSPHELPLYYQLADLQKTKLNMPDRAISTIDKMVAANRDQAEVFVQRARFRLANKLPGALDDLAHARDMKPEDADLAVMTASMLLSEGNPEKALESLTRALAKNPQSFGLYNMLAMAQQNAGKFEDALVTLKKGVEELPDSPLRYGLCELYVLTGKYDEAKKIIEWFKDKPGGEFAVPFHEGLIGLAQKNWPLAVERFETLAKMFMSLPKESRAPEYERKVFTFLGQANEGLGNPEAALAAYQTASNATPDNAALRFKISALLASLGRFEDSVRELRDVPMTAPGARSNLLHARIMLNATLPAAAQKWTDVENLLAEEERSSPKALTTLSMRLSYLLARGKLPEARELVVRARGDYPKLVFPSISLTELLIFEKKFDEAAKVLDEAQAKFGDTADIRLERIRYWTARGSQDPAIKAEASKQIATLAKDINKFTSAEQSTLFELLASANRRLGDKERSDQLLQASIAQAPDNIRLRVKELSQALELGDDAKIQDVISNLKRIEGNDGVFWRIGDANRLFLLATKSKTTDGLDQATMLLNEVLARRPDNIDTTRVLGLIEDIQGKSDLAITHMQKAFDQGVRQPYLLRRLSMLLLERKRYVDANKVMIAWESPGPKSGEEKKLVAEVAIRAGDEERASILLADAVDPASKDPLAFNWLAQMYFALKKLPEAETTAQRAVTIAPTLAPAHLTLVQIIVARGDKPRASVAATAAEKAMPAGSWIELAAIHRAIGDVVRADSCYSAALKAKPNDARTLREAAGFYQLSGQFDKAAEAYRSLLTLDSKISGLSPAEVRRGLAQSLAAVRRPKARAEAETLINQNLKELPGSVPDLRVRLSIFAATPWRKKETLQLFESIREKQPLSVEESFAFAQILDTDGQWPQARQQILSILNVANPPLRPGLWYVNKLLRRNEPDEAIIWLSKLEREEPKSVDVPMLKAQWLSQKKQTAEAVALMEAKAKEAPEFTPRFARVLQEIHQPEPAIKLLREYVKGSKLPAAPLVLAEALALNGQLPEALDIIDASWGKADLGIMIGVISAVLESPAGKSDSQTHARLLRGLQTALVANPKSSAILSTIAQVLTADEKLAQAEEFYSRALSSTPDETGVSNNYAWLLCFMPGRAKDALNLIQKAIDTEGPEVHFLDTRGLVNLALGQVPAAIADFEASIEGKPHDLTTVYFHLALALNASNQPKKAKETLRKAETLGFKADSLHILEQPSYKDLVGKLSGKK